MKGAVIALLCAAALAHAELNENGCPINPYVDVLKPHPNCNKYYQCTQGELLERTCASDLVFDVETQTCDWPANVDCNNRIPPPTDHSEEENQPENENGGNSDPTEAPKICAAEGSDGVLVAHENCNQFYVCDAGTPVTRDCWGNLLFNPVNNQCDWPDNVKCGDRVIGGGNGDQDGGNGEGGNGDGDDGNNGSGGNSDPSEAPKICAAEESDGVLVAHENCNQFYVCDAGTPVARDCWGNLLFNPVNNQCDWPDNVKCGDRVIGGGNGDQDGGNGEGGNGDGDDGNNSSGGNSDPSEAPKICAAEGSDGVLVAHENCNQFYNCHGGKPIALNCWGNLLFNPVNNQCDWPENVNCGDRVIGGGNGDQDGDNGDGGNGDNGGNGEGGNGGNSDPSEAPKICAAEGSDGVLVAHENCNQFYNCHGGKPIALNCGGNLLFNPVNNQCDWPENVNCGDRVIGGGNGDQDGGNGEGGNGNGDDGNNGNGGNSDPSEAPKICAAEESHGVLVAHENCNQFYVCDAGTPVARDCWGNLLFNPVNNQCDWPENVNCADRVIGGGNGDQDGDNGDGGNGDNGGYGEGGNGGNSDPSEAPKICAAEGSDGVLVAHENCNQFYNCHGGEPIALNCWGNLLFNPVNNQCDWPENVNCGDRVIGGGNGDQDGDNGDGGNGDNGGNGEDSNGGNSDPSEAPKICAAEGSDGVLVAHENCNQFYNCHGGEPIALNCWGNLLFNPVNNQCDWPENVNCGDRVIGGGNGDQDGDNGDGGNGDNGGNGEDSNGGNSDPSEAPKICAAEGSDGVLVAHENCNQFYNCHGGEPIALNCWGNLLFNPVNNQCDWPDNVNCGDRVIGGGDSDGDGGNEDGGNEGGDNGNGGEEDSGNDNGGNGGGHDDPSKAEEICAAQNDEDVLVAHEDCNKFYQCIGGKPVVRFCYGDLYFNPSTDTCDWPHNVACGSRNIPAVSFNKHHRHAIRV